MSRDENSSTLSERAEAFSVEALLGIKNSILMDYNQESSSDNNQQIGDQKNETENKIEMELISSELWSQFHKMQNEMIITKNGRRIFPTLKVLVKGLDPNSQYIIWIDMVPVDQLRYRYVYHSSRWIVAGSGEKYKSNSIYMHPDGPSSGKYWMSHIITFDKVKLTNSKEPKSKGQISLLSMHKYQPRIHIQMISDDSKDSFHKINSSNSLTFTFPETQFFTVTAYQNQQITHLKIAWNPFAKGFREVNKNSQRKLGGDLLMYQNSIEPLKSQSNISHRLGYRGNDTLSNNTNIMENERLSYFPPSLIHPTNLKERDQNVYDFQTNVNSPLFFRETFTAPFLSDTNLNGFPHELKTESYLKGVYTSFYDNSNINMVSHSDCRYPVDNQPLALHMSSTIGLLPSTLEYDMTQAGFSRIQSNNFISYKY
ncbi:t-box transcription factor TBX18 [Nephila pilipes]|uniref:T-box transcription factor TBX18 n=1 Tax=Nephila pilipes TaxID=299642 RepID=A0A8X6UEJ2_NEPPI|nr:t-box transcription factor TBX18 [Nephila pilipes]